MGRVEWGEMGTLLIALAAMLWGSDLLFRPVVLASGWSAARVVLAEHLLLTALFAGSLWAGRRALAALTTTQWSLLLFIAWGGSALATWLYTQAFTLGSPLPAILLQKTQPLFALLLAGCVLGERRTRGFWLWCALALAGAYALTGITTLPSCHDLRWQQAACALGAAALWGAATVAGRLLSPCLLPVTLAGARFALALPPLALICLLTSSKDGMATLHTGGNWHAWALLGLIVLLPDWLGMGFYYAGLRGTPASVATLAELCYPLTALIIGVAVQGTHLTPWQWAGLALLAGSVMRLGVRPDVQSNARDTPSNLLPNVGQA